MSQPPNYPYPPGTQGQPKKGGMGIVAIILLVVLGAVVVIGGILAVLAIYGTRKYISAAKQTEARSALSQIGSLSKAAFARDGKICPSASKPVPFAGVPKAAKYQSMPADWEADKAANAGFACLGFEMSMPQYYQYDYKATATGFTATARGDLDGDGVTSELSLEGKIVSGNLEVAPVLKETNAAE